jgi:NADH:ubiquinone oxidoreductase subunit E
MEATMQPAVEHRPLPGHEHLKHEFSDEQLESVDRIILDNRGKPGALIPVLKDVQDITLYLPTSLQKEIARGLNLAFSEVFGVVTFYSFFRTQPPGRHSIKVCLGTACYVRGNKDLVETLSRNLYCDVGETTSDKRFSLEGVRCLGCCGIAPVITVDEDVYREIRIKDLSTVLPQYE